MAECLSKFHSRPMVHRVWALFDAMRFQDCPKPCSKLQKLITAQGLNCRANGDYLTFKFSGKCKYEF